ncbi:hypothetical protein EBZ35_06685, partial [bacterium]|nr:hypothetical protein [bacterium]
MAHLLVFTSGLWGGGGFYFEGQLWDAVTQQPVEGSRNVTIEVISGLVKDGVGPGSQVRWSQRIPYQFEEGLIWVEIGKDIPLDPSVLLSPNIGVGMAVSGVLGNTIYPIRPIPLVVWVPLAQQALSVKSEGIQEALRPRSVAGSYPQIREIGPLTGLQVGGVVVTVSPPRLGIGVGVPATATLQCPISLLCRVCTPIKKIPPYKVTIDSNRPSASLASLFPDLLKPPPHIVSNEILTRVSTGASTVLSVLFDSTTGEENSPAGGEPVEGVDNATILVSKTGSGRYRIQASSPSALALIISTFIDRMTRFYAPGG